MTKSRAFLKRLGMEHFAEQFENCGLGNLSNLFQLEAKDLAISLGVQAPGDQKHILDELRRIAESFTQHLSQQTNQNSYTPFSQTLNHNALVAEQFNVLKQQSIFNLIRSQQQMANDFQTMAPNQMQANGFLV
ncbi:hypothetical protein BpHYR1_029825 [Brachionus plicatilis]|uniref:SAM domain-containing protein n=1 Tax=Brachionus plicatilis TaxID=10195 RepID=A0A3M7S972_BRAPC|nr:hypothetical protein BpHYR1_029825 [Brachionus plicatilis]